jgi:hypothetical protein
MGYSPRGDADSNAVLGESAGATHFEGPSVDGDAHSRQGDLGPK